MVDFFRMLEANSRWPLYQFVITDGFGRGRTVLFALTQTEKQTDTRQILQSFKNIIGDTSKTTTFTVGCALGQLRALNDEFPSASIILCLFHVCQSFRKKFSIPFVKKWLYRMAHTSSYATFRHCVRIIDLIDRAAGAITFQYFSLLQFLFLDILCDSERWTKSYNVFHELPRVVRQVPDASVEFRNKYPRLRARIAHLNKID
ncbi:hypothetical protein MN116_000064 [Schistosoma mekongi]|uniref:ZSWIM1/3 RNaseH-like domain-containing protein n=1 Tax=Schistosoma mekongi TaxID=38744 RepID=A0AAE2D8Q1_SCHME|nr:hypothetical protein MN116_000064 [Schistosoma mekongi]